jgi:iron-sulfur cluster insertion protein
MITVTEAADLHLSSIIAENNLEGILLAVKGGGCSGFNYDWQPLEKLDTKVTDFELDLDVGKLILDGTSIMYLAGMEVDYRKDIFGQKLMVENPNVQSMCGCGESFSPKGVVFTSGPYSATGMDLTNNVK